MKQIFFGFIALAGFAAAAFAHPPSDIKVSYDLKDHILRASIIHDVRNPAKHFIAKVTVAVNGTQMVLQQFSSQLDNNEQQVLYFIIDAKKGDEIAVTGFCVIFGQKTVKLTVSDQPGNKTGTGG